MMKVIDILLKILTFGAQNQFMISYTTTVGSTIYVGESWALRPEASRIIILRHEVVHLRQAKKYTLPLFWILYLFVFFPAGLAYFRWIFEKAAYTETLKAIADVNGRAALSRIDKEGIVKQFTGAAYLWPWPFRKTVEQWYDSTVAEILAQTEEK